MAWRAAPFVLLAFCITSAQAVHGADVLYDTLNLPVHVNGNFSDGVWLALSFKTRPNTESLESVSIPIRNPNFLSSGSIQFSLFDDSGENGLPGQAIGSPLGSVPISGISTSSYDVVSFTGLNRYLTTSTSYWIVVSSTGVSSVFFIGATNMAGGVKSGSAGYTMSTTLGSNWNPASTSYYAIGQVVAVPEPSAAVLGVVAGLMALIPAVRRRSLRA